jgi:predicted acyltransferase (DUF342 family)
MITQPKCDRNYGSGGGVMFVVVGALVVLSIMGAVVSRLTSSSGGTEIQENRFGEAYYAAYSGIQYLNSIEKNKTSAYTDLTDFVTKVNSGSPYSLPGGAGRFQLVIAAVSGSTTKYTVSTLVGSAVGGASASRESNFVLKYSGVRTFTPPSGSNKLLDYVQSGYDVTSSSSMKTNGNIYATNDITLVEGNVVSGNLVAHHAVTLGSAVKIYGTIYSSGTVTLGPNNEVSKDITAIGAVTVGSGSKTQSISSNSSVKLQSSGQVVTGNINAGGDVTISSGATITGDVISGGNVTLDSSACKIGGNIHASGDVAISSGSIINGKVVAGGTITVASSSAQVKGGMSSGGGMTIGSSFSTVGGLVSGGKIILADKISIGTDLNTNIEVQFGGYDTVVNGSVYCNNTLNIPVRVTIEKNTNVGGDIVITAGACIKGSAYAKGTITECKATACGSWECYIFSRKEKEPSVTLPSTPETPQKPTAVVKIAEETPPNPPLNTNSKDGKLSVGNSKTYTFSAGTYYFSEIFTDYGSKLRFDLSKGDITIFSTGIATFGNSMSIWISEDGKNYSAMSAVDPLLSAKIYLEANSNIILGYNANWFGALISRGTITFDGSNDLIGMYASFGGVVKSSSGSDATVKYVLSNYAKTYWYQ